MISRVQHLRADKEVWKSADAVIPDGEIALYKRSDGSYGLKIGDGRRKFSLLPSLTKEVIVNTDEAPVITLKGMQDVRCGSIKILTLEIPSEDMTDEYEAWLSFDTDDSEEFDLRLSSHTVYFSGEDYTDHSFTPLKSLHYRLHFYYDGKLRCEIQKTIK